MQYHNRKEINHAKQQAEAILTLMDSISRILKRTWRSLGRVAAYTRLAQSGDIGEMLARAHGIPLHRR